MKQFDVTREGLKPLDAIGAENTRRFIESTFLGAIIAWTIGLSITAINEDNVLGYGFASLTIATAVAWLVFEFAIWAMTNYWDNHDI